MAVLALFALLSTACGAVVTANQQREAALDTGAAPVPAPAPAVAPADDATQPVQNDDSTTAVDTAATSATSATSGVEAGGHSFGSTLDEWVATDGDDASGLGDPSPGYVDIEWPDLVPEGSSGEELMARFEDRLDEVEPGTQEANDLWLEIQSEYDPAAVTTSLDGNKIRLAGFVAPLTYDKEIVTEFLLVPTFGACIHVPAPPPNQTIMVSLDVEDGLTIDESWGAVWVEGTLVIESGTTDLGATGYTIIDATTGGYSTL